MGGKVPRSEQRDDNVQWLTKRMMIEAEHE